ncbi:MAG: hypothetical protein SOY25_03015 [Eubacteriales bacterium]|nr:hypothetical protein [Eubacteriales bacterium]
MKDLIRIEEELEELKHANVENEKCLVIDAANVYLLDSKTKLSLTDYFTEKWPKSTFRPMWSMCFTTPGEITTIKEIHVHCLECWMKYIIVYKYLWSGGLPKECMDFARRYTPDLYKMIKKEK